MERGMIPSEEARRLATTVVRGEFKPEGLYPYTNEKGEPLFWRWRVRLPDGSKIIRPMRKNGEGYELGEPDFPNGKPLYRLHELAAHPGARVWYVEGENCADALAKLGLLATTAGGATSDEKADFPPMAKRTVTIWPDNDRPGIEHAQRVAVKLQALACNVEMIDARALGLPEGGDCVDWLKAHPGATAADLARLARVRPPKFLDEGAVIHCKVSDIEATPIRWLWPGRIARGKVSMIAGHPNLGKSQITTSMAAVVTQGGRWPVDRTPCERGSVLLLSAEDDVADTIRPRLEAAGAEIQRPFNLKEDIRRLEAVLVGIGDVALIVIDPVSAYLGGTDSHNNADVRTLLAPLAEAAARTGAAVVAVSHLNKGGAAVGGDALLRVTGSLAFVAAARAAYIVAKDPADGKRRLFLPAKNNVAADIGGLAFRIEGCNSGHGIETSRVAWEAEPVNDVSADELLGPQADPEERSALDDAKAWTESMLADGPMASKKFMAEGREAGHSERSLERARKALKVEAFKDESVPGRANVAARWMLLLPLKTAKTPQERRFSSAGDVGGLGGLGGPPKTHEGTIPEGEGPQEPAPADDRERF
jgi:hypothetical protein